MSVADDRINLPTLSATGTLMLRPWATMERSMPIAAYREHAPAELRALLSYLRRERRPSAVTVVPLQTAVEDEIDAIVESLLADVTEALATAVEDGRLDPPSDGADPRFDYDTRLVLPAMLTLGHLRVRAGDVPGRRALPGRSVDEQLVAEARETTMQVVRALIDGDLRDAINDEEYEDVQTNVSPRSTVAEIAQQRLQSDVESWLDDEETPEAVREHYDHAVEISEGHQTDDRRFRELLATMLSDDPDRRAAAENAVVEEYKFADASEFPALYAETRGLPYFRTQYERVGILYEDMLRMYEADLGIDLGDDLVRSIVLMVIGAQIGLDDTDDYPEDRGEQLTPVTAEYHISAEDEQPTVRIEQIVDAYLDRAAAASPDAMTGIAVEYIRHQAHDRIDRLPDAAEPDTSRSSLQ